MAWTNDMKTLSAMTVLIQAESFRQPGGWVPDTQSMPVLGSLYLLAHGLGVALDLHCPLLSGWTNNELYFVGTPADAQWPRVVAFIETFDRLRRGPLPHDPQYDLPFGRDWNTGEHAAHTAAAWFAGQIDDGFAATLEVPYAIAGGQPVTPESARALGRDLAAALAESVAGASAAVKPEPGRGNHE